MMNGGSQIDCNPSSRQLYFTFPVWFVHQHSTLSRMPSQGVGSTIGAGVYILVGTVARELSGPALTLSFLLVGIAVGLSAFCYAELGSRCPSAGRAYNYSYICIKERCWLGYWLGFNFGIQDQWICCGPGHISKSGESRNTTVKQFANYISDLEIKGSGIIVPEFPARLDWLNTAPLQFRRDLKGKGVLTIILIYASRKGVAWVIGWGLILEYRISGSAVARGISPNLVNLGIPG